MVHRLFTPFLKPSTSLLVLIVLPFWIQAQIVKINCIEPKEITLPVTEGHTEEIHYVDHDKHTFWYRIDVKSNLQFSYMVGGVQSAASYEVEMYAFDGIGFCKQLVKEQLEALSKASAFSLKSKKGKSYYLGITNSSPHCGHEITITHDDKLYVLRSTLFGSECADKNDYSRTIPEETVSEQSKLINPLEVHGKVENKLTGGSLNADMTFKRNDNEDIHVIAYRLKGYSTEIEKSKKYRLTIKSLGYLPLDTIVELKRSSKLDFQLLPVASGGKFIMENIYFYPNTFAYKPESEVALEALKDYMLENNGLTIEIQGHTNGNKNIRKSKDNEKLGEEWNYEGTATELSRLRAEKLKDYLVRNGIAAKRITTVGKGGDEMIIKEPKDMEEAAKNIRVEIRILTD